MNLGEQVRDQAHAATGESGCRASRWICACLPPLAGALLALALTAWSKASIDTGWILDFGRTVLETGRIPRVETRSFLDPGHPLVMHEWLACVGLYALWKLGAGPALILARWVSVVALLFLMDRGIAHRSTFARTVSLLAAAATLGPAVALTRPQLATWLGLAVVVWALHAPRRGLFALPALFLLWGNLHAGYLAGLGILVAGLGARKWEEPDLPTGAIALVAALCLAATFVNPYGIGLITHNLGHALGAASHLTNHEWRSPLRADARPWEIRGLLALAVTLALGTWKARDRRAWTLALLGTAAALVANRHFRMAPILLLPLLAETVERLEQALPGKRSRLGVLLSAATAVLASSMLLAGGSRLFRFVPYRGPDPGAAVEVIRRNALQGAVWNDFNAGSILLWAAPRVQVSCDGRNVAAYAPQVLLDCVAFGSTPAWPQFKASGARYALLPWDHPALDDLEAHLAELYRAQGYVLLGPARDRSLVRDTPTLPLHESDYYQWHWELDRPFQPPRAP